MTELMSDREQPESPQEMHRRQEREAVAVETAAMHRAFTALQPLGEEARYRAIRWLARALDLPSREPPF